MSKVGELEKKTKQRVIALLQDRLHYKYLGNWTERENRNIETDILVRFLITQEYDYSLIDKAIYKVQQAAATQNKSLYDINKEFYTLLRYGVPVKSDIGEHTQRICLVNWKEPAKNFFAFAEEVTVHGKHVKRPDIVIYVNGIALGILELKRSTVSVSEGIRQNLLNQEKEFIQSFFSTIQLVMAGSETEGLRFGTIETPEKKYALWKEADKEKYSHLRNPEVDKLLDNSENLLHRDLIGLLCKERLLEIIFNFIVYDRGIKKLCRHNQYFGNIAAYQYIKRREGGIIWHTQGSGKSLTMVWLTRWVLENIEDSRVLIITDRIELDEQIEKVFIGVKENIVRTKNGRDLIDKLNTHAPRLICSLIHKFGRKEDREYDDYINELNNSLPPDFSAKGDIYVWVDEAHRTQSGKLHDAMKKILNNALFIGFTGTPLLKKDKKKSIEVFGPYIHTYKFDEGVRDKVVVDLRYEARDVEQNITSQDKIDQWFDAKTRGLTKVAKAELKKRWGTMQKVLSSQSRLEKIVADILLDLETKDRLQNGRGNAMLVSGSIYQACKYYELFQAHGLKKCAIITSYSPSPRDIKNETTGEMGLTEKLKQYEIYIHMLNGKDVEIFETEVKKKFVDEPGQMKLLIVVDKLLTGFDAPSATYLYIDKNMYDHGLFQAICRVNRLDGDDKEYGYIVDYKDLFKSLEKSIINYTSEAFADFDTEDVEGLLKNRLKSAKDDLEEALEYLHVLCEPVEHPKDFSNYRKYFCGIQPFDEDDEIEYERKRIMLYKMTSRLVRTYAAIANEMEQAGYSIAETEEIKLHVKNYENIRAEIKLASGDYIDLKSYEPAMRHLIDTYISAEESEKIAVFDDFTLLDLIVERGKDAINALPDSIKNSNEAVAETIENNVRRVINDERPTNPKYYEKMSILLDELINERKVNAKYYKEYLKKIIDLAKKVKTPEDTPDYPASCNTRAKRALYDNLNNDEELTLKLDDIIRNTKKDGWRGNTLKEREIVIAIKKYIKDEVLARKIFELVKNQHEY